MVEPLPWPGNPAQPLDDTNLGKYLFEVADSATGQLRFSRGFSSIYGEWETTAEAKSINRTFSESLRFPLVDRPVRLAIKKRDARNLFREVWSLALDPAGKFVERGAAAAAAGPLLKLHDSGDPAKKLDLLILGDGYTAAERAKFERDARRLVAVLLATSPFKERQRDINVWGLSPASPQSGISRPSQQIFRRTPLGTTYDAFDSERYVLTFDNRAFRDLAANAPYDVVEILVNSATYGGGGIFGLYSTVAADSAWAPYIFVHEFGHHLAALADEYYTSDVAYLPAQDRVEPWEPNVTALLDPAGLKWKDLVEPGTPLPTPWPKEEFEQYSKQIQQRRREIRAANRPESEMDALVPGGAGVRDRTAPARAVRRPGRRVRGSQLRGARLFPATDRLRHVHSGSQRVLRRLPARDRQDARSLQPVTKLEGCAGKQLSVISGGAFTCLTRAAGFVRLAANLFLRLEGASWMNSTAEWDFPMTS